MGHHQRNVIFTGNGVLMDQTQPPPPLIEQDICFCSKFLNPFSSSFGNSHLVTPNNLQHYCRVCNIQLNSCRQAKIHSEGKKHDKRLSYLRFCLESSDTSAAVAYMQNGAVSTPMMDTPPPNSVQMTVPQQLPLVQTIVQQQPPSSGVPPPTIVHQPCNIPPPQGAIYTGYSSVPPPHPGQGAQLQPLPNVLPQNCSSTIPQLCSSSSMATASIYQQQALPSVVTTTSPYYYPQATTTSVAGTQVAQGALGYHSMPPPLHHHQATYYDYTYMAPMISVDGSMSGQSSNSQLASMPMHHNQPPPPLATPMNIYPTSNICTPSTNNTYTTNNNGQVIFHCPSNAMSPSLTSGFSGSGGDCKSTETSSILSTTSFSSNAMHYNNHNHKKKGACNAGTMRDVDKMNNNTMSNNNGSSGNKEGLINEKGFVAICEICQLPFPSQAVLENHLRGSRHARRVKSQQAFKQLHDNGAVFRHEEGVSEIRCEVCHVSVNSSHQLQAHLIGHKHRVRAVRRGVKPNQAIIIPSSSTDVTTTSPSGASSESGNESPPSQSASGQQQQPKHQKQKQQKQSQQIQQVNTQGISTSGSLQRRRRSSAFIVPPNLSGPTSSSSITTANGSTVNDDTQLNRRHRSSGCLSKHCSHSTLSLSNTAFSQNRARSSSDLNKMHSRSMNLLMLHPGGFAQSIRQDDSSSTDEGFDRDDRRKVKQRPRSYSTRTAKEGDAGTANRNDKSSTPAQQHQLEKKSFLQKRSKSSKNHNVEHHVKGILNSLVMKSQHKDKQQQSRHQKSLNKQQVAVTQNDQKVNNGVINPSMRRSPNHSSTSIKPSKSSVAATQSIGNAPSSKKTSSSSNSKKLKNIPMLGVFLEGLNNNSHHFSSNNKKNNNNNNNNNNNYNNNSNTTMNKLIKSCENKKKQHVLEKPQLANGISTNGVTENNLTNKVAA